MTLSSNGLLRERPHYDGVQRIYRLPNGYLISMVNAPRIRSHPYAWEAAVLNAKGEVVYDTPLSDDVEVFMNDVEANAFLWKAMVWGNRERKKLRLRKGKPGDHA